MSYILLSSSHPNPMKRRARGVHILLCADFFHSKQHWNLLRNFFLNEIKNLWTMLFRCWRHSGTATTIALHRWHTPLLLFNCFQQNNEKKKSCGAKSSHLAISLSFFVQSPNHKLHPDVYVFRSMCTLIATMPARNRHWHWQTHTHILLRKSCGVIWRRVHYTHVFSW